MRSQFYEAAKGYSIEAVYGGSVAQNTVDMFKKIKHEQIIKAATFDLLFSEQDRHGQNVFVTEEGDITLIDSEGCFGPTNSLLLPGGQKFEVYWIGYNAVLWQHSIAVSTTRRRTLGSTRRLGLSMPCQRPFHRFRLAERRGTIFTQNPENDRRRRPQCLRNDQKGTRHPLEKDRRRNARTWFRRFYVESL